MEFFILIKATQKSGKPDAVHWQTAKTEARANLMLDVALEDAGIETGRGHDYNKPARTDFPVFDDLPEEGTVDFEWCKRYELADDGRTWQPIQIDETDDEEKEEQNAAIESYKMGLSVELAHFWLGGAFTATPEERAAAIKAQMDMDNNYLQNVILAVNSVEPLKQCHNHIRHTLLEAIKLIWPLDGKIPELSQVLAFSTEWIEALNDNSAGRGNHRANVIEKWKAKSAPQLVKVGAGVFDATALFNAPSKDTAAENTDYVPVEETINHETKAGTEVLPGEAAINSTESHAVVNQEADTLNNDTAHHKDETEEQLFTHLMVDLEAFGSTPDAPIVSIGAVFFNPKISEMGSEFYKVISLASSMDSGGLPDADTILWWMKQSAEARSAILVDAIPLDDALLQLNEFICENAANGPASVQLWGNGATYDNVLLRSSYKRTGIPVLWEFWNDRDERTIVELGKAIGINPRYEIPFEGDQHNALADARHQAKYVSAIWQKLIKD